MELYHYGIKGQKWGVRRYQYGDGTYTEEGKKRRRVGAPSVSINADVKGFVDEILVDAGLELVGALAAVAVVAGARAVAKAIKLNKLDKKVEKSSQDRTTPIDKMTGFHLRTDNKPIEEDLVNVNIGRTETSLDGSIVGSKIGNCGYCAMATELRARGYDVMAKNVDGINAFSSYQKYFPKIKFDAPSKPNGAVYIGVDKRERLDIKFKDKKTKAAFERTQQASAFGMNTEFAKNCISGLKSSGDSRGCLLLYWGIGGGHAANYEVKNGKFRILDGQIGQAFSEEESIEYLANSYMVFSGRLDNLDFDSKALKEAIV